MTYEEFINNILETRGRFECGDEYHERHHILPKCMGGTDDEDNLIDLFAREHFEAHRLLAIENPKISGLQFAWWNMCQCPGSSKKRENVTPEEYEEARVSFVLSISGKNHPMYGIHRFGEDNPMYGRCHNEEAKQRMSDIKKGENNPFFGKHHSEEHKAKLSEAYRGENAPLYGRTWWDENTPQEKIDEWKMRLSKSLSGKNNPMYGRCGKNHPRAKTVEQYDLNGNLICIWGSAREASRELGINATHISACCRGQLKTSGGFKWRYKDEHEKEQGELNA